jgi:signal transduction histidine kinase/ActR/RegA family two-component response regulator
MARPPAPTDSTAPVPRELIGREVSVRALLPVWNAARARGIAPERLAAGTGVPIEQLTQPRERVSWTAFARVMSNLGTVLDDDDLVSLGSSMLDSPVLRALFVSGRLLFGVPDVYRWVFGSNGPASQLFAANEGRVQRIAPDRMRLEIRMREGYAPSRENFLVLRGTLVGLSHALGAECAAVAQLELRNGVAYEIVVPARHGILGAARSLLSWIFAARSAAEELRSAHYELHERYVELQREIEARVRVEADRQRLEEQLRQSQKMEAVGRLAGGVAHDFNNLLSVILSYTALAIEDPRLAASLRVMLEEVQKAGERASHLTGQLLTFSRQQLVQPRVLDLNRILRDMESMIRRMIGEDVTLRTLPRPDVARVKADEGHIAQVLMNLAVNARDAMPRGGQLTIETDNVELVASREVERMGLRPGDYVVLSVTDNGVGMDAPTLAHIFEPFFTTKGPGKGSGLGLSTVFGIAEQSGGAISVWSEPGKGSTFKLYLPAVDSPAERETFRRSTRLSGSETVLVVDDEAPVRAVIRRILKRSGYRVVEAGSATEAVRQCQMHRGAIHVLLTDVVMPETSGRELADQLKPDHSDLRVIFMTGYTNDAVVQHGLIDGERALLHKPITPDSLLRKIREALDSSEVPRA